ncbi:DUF29 domain-containing protein [Massilia violaceinigra]|uniref:DUF29 domain-containing protein n=1 Tax=Massilia violaceinigra TaxID=2045208 RepID=A0ABY4A754_9BURK|nr:DUF29 domain-containing protein [Massilia violaceinigra]UOD30595.1 DUF29 domain-containing protein [Massilia violaceinigra]
MNRQMVLPVGYEDDFVLWIEQQANLLNARQFEQLDIHHLTEELKAMVGHRRRELGSRLEVLIMHLLKCQFQPSFKSSSWLNTIDQQRGEIAELVRESPSLAPTIAQVARRRYARARRMASRETQLDRKEFPSELPYSVQQLLDDDFVP